MPTEVHPDLLHIINNHKQLFPFSWALNTLSTQVRPLQLKSHHIPYHFILQKKYIINCKKCLRMHGIIQPSNMYSPWCAPAVYVPKGNREIHICVDFVQLNHVTKRTPTQYPGLKARSKIGW